MPRAATVAILLCMPRPMLKSAAWERLDGQLRIVYDLREQFVVDDADGSVEALLVLLRDGGRSVEELADVMGVPAADLAGAVELLDAHGLVETDEARRLGPEVRERHASNLAFFESFASMSRGSVELCRSVWDAHVLVLGTGGLNSNVLPHLAGLGVGRLTLLDCDVVERRNFARQYLYAHRDLGARKVERAAEWVRRFDPRIEVTTVDHRIDGPGFVADLLAEYRPDVVASGADSPDAVDGWVNEACVPAGVPFVRAGMWVTQGIVWSVSPGRSACLGCRPAAPSAALSVGPAADAAARSVGPAAPSAGLAVPDGVASLDEERATLRLHASRPRTNRGIGPVAGLLGSLAAFEVLRYLSRFEPPAYAGRPLKIDFAAGCAMSQSTWTRDPRCAICVGVRREEVNVI